MQTNRQRREKHSIRRLEALETRDLLTAGLSALGNQYWHLDVEDILRDAVVGDEFGRSVSAGDFNRDGFADLAVGMPGKTVDGNPAAGALSVIYGRLGGLNTFGNQFWSQGRNGIGADLEPGDRFGTALTVGDFNGDTFDDIAIGAPRDSVAGEPEAGVVNIIYGSSNVGLISTNNQFFSQDLLNLTLEAGARFGRALAAGDFDNDGFDDLVVGAPMDTVGGVDGAGSVSVIYGSAAGLSADGSLYFTQGANAGVNDEVGASFAVGDFDRDGFDDLAVGVPGEAVGGVVGAGAVNVVYGSATGLTTDGNQVWNRGVGDILGQVRTNAEFGRSLAAGDFDRDGHADLAVGAPGDRVNSQNNAGSVSIIRGSSLGLTDERNQLWSQDAIQFGTSRTNDRFGASLVAGDFDGTFATQPVPTLDDLAIGVPGDSIPNFATTNSGSANVFYGSNNGLTLQGVQLWHQENRMGGILGIPRSGERFGAALASGDFDNNGFSDLGVGVPLDTINMLTQTFGAVNAIYGSDIQVAPVAADDMQSTESGVAVTIDVLANDTDDGALDVSSVRIATAPGAGTAVVDTATGTVTYTPNAGFVGNDEFRYTVRDDDGLISNEATVRVVVTVPNMPPVAVADIESTDEDTPARFIVLDNDTDSDGQIDPTTVAIVVLPTRGFAVPNPLTGEVLYTPFTNVFGTDEFQYTVRDDDGDVSNAATVSVTINPVNDPPSARHDRRSTSQNVAVVIDVLANDVDIDGQVDETSVQIVMDPSNGSASADPVTGMVTYTPNPGFNGDDTFGYTVKDDLGAVSATALVRINVGTGVIPPVASNDRRSTGKSAPVTIDVLANDTDEDDMILASSVMVTSAPGNGATAVDSATGAITYTPIDGFAGVDEFEYTVRDESNNLSNVATVSVTVAGWQNQIRHFDVNGDGFLVPLDALLVINEINDPEIVDASGAIILDAKDPATNFLDVNGDNFIVALDALQVINCLNSACAAQPAAAAAAVPRDERPGVAPREQAESTAPHGDAISLEKTRRAIAAVFDQLSDLDDKSRKLRDDSASQPSIVDEAISDWPI